MPPERVGALLERDRRVLDDARFTWATTVSGCCRPAGCRKFTVAVALARQHIVGIARAEDRSAQWSCAASRSCRRSSALLPFDERLEEPQVRQEHTVQASSFPARACRTSRGDKTLDRASGICWSSRLGESRAHHPDRRLAGSAAAASTNAPARAALAAEPPEFIDAPSRRCRRQRRRFGRGPRARRR